MSRELSSKTRVTITLPEQLLKEIDRQVKNRSRFILEAVERELERRRLELLQESLATPHSESVELADAGFREWVEAGASDSDLLDPDQGRAVSWKPGCGWQIEIENE